MKTYLNMDEVLRHCRRYIGQEYDEPYLVSAVPEEVIRSLPPANVMEVVICADCRSFQCNIRQDENGNLVVPVGVPKFECRWWCAEVNPKDYCSYAKRKEEADNG